MKRDDDDVKEGEGKKSNYFLLPSTPPCNGAL
jgi:hypothetical protein